jgi:hypothetical protein
MAARTSRERSSLRGRAGAVLEVETKVVLLRSSIVTAEISTVAKEQLVRRV